MSLWLKQEQIFANGVWKLLILCRFVSQVNVSWFENQDKYTEEHHLFAMWSEGIVFIFAYWNSWDSSNSSNKQHCRRQRWYPVLVSLTLTCSLPYVTLFLDYLLVWLFWVHPRLLASPRVCACDTFCGLCLVFSKMNEKVLMYCKLYFHILKHC